MDSVRTRIAPSPTGYPHIGTIYQALFDYAWAHKNNGHFVVRIEDTDRERFISDAEEKIYDALDWFDLSEDESPRKGGPYKPYKQSERLDIYRKYAQELIKKGHAYYCFCSKERLDELRKKLSDEKKQIKYDKHCLHKVKDAHQRIANGEPYVIRLNVEPDKKIWFEDGIRGRVEFDSNVIDDQVLLKSDGFPTYHLAVVVDDYLMKITHIIRGEEWVSSTPKHIILYDSFGWKQPLFFHVPLLRNPDKSKMSKRHGHTAVSWYQEEGFLPEAILNYLALMGWSHPEQKEKFSLSEFMQLFELKDLKPVGPIFDIEKLRWLNGLYLREMKDDDLKGRLKEYYKHDSEFIAVFEKNPHIDLLIGLAKTRMKTLKDFKSLIDDTVLRVYTDIEKQVARQLIDVLEPISVTDWKEASLLEKLKSFSKEKNVPMKTIYFVITGREQGLPLIESMTQIRDRNTVLDDLKKASK